MLHGGIVYERSKERQVICESGGIVSFEYDRVLRTMKGV